MLGSQARQILAAAEFGVECRYAHLERQESGRHEQFQPSTGVRRNVPPRPRQVEHGIHGRAPDPCVVQPERLIGALGGETGHALGDTLGIHDGNDLARGDPIALVDRKRAHGRRKLRCDNRGLRHHDTLAAQVEQRAEEQVAKPQRQQEDGGEIDQTDRRLPVLPNLIRQRCILPARTETANAHQTRSTWRITRVGTY